MLAKLLRDYDYKEAFELFENSRKERCETIVLDGRRRGEDKKPVSWFTSKIREWILWMVMKYFATAENWILDYKIEW